jgi:hypothetical protein
MIPGQIEKNLVVFLDPSAPSTSTSWLFIDWKAHRKNHPGNNLRPTIHGRGIIYSFHRRFYFQYLWFLLRAPKVYPGSNIRAVLYICDGLLSSLCDARSIAAYRSFASCHVPRTKCLRQKLLSLLPISIRAERKYVAISSYASSPTQNGTENCLLHNDLMFFSNAPGKLMMTTTSTLVSGHGALLKTTSNSDYAKVMEREFLLMRELSALMQPSVALLPIVRKQFRLGDNLFFTEEYIKGRTLREIMHSLKPDPEGHAIHEIYERLNGWFSEYSALHNSEPRALTSCYDEVLNLYGRVYLHSPETNMILAHAQVAVSHITCQKEFITPIVAHNDLWPGNFVVQGNRLIALDWERATRGRAPYFDYFWMIISAAIEYLGVQRGRNDYSRDFRLFVKERDNASSLAAQMLRDFLVRNGFAASTYPLFLFLFLIEWSIQGYCALGRYTEMDQLAHEELIRYVDQILPAPTTNAK